MWGIPSLEQRVGHDTPLCLKGGSREVWVSCSSFWPHQQMFFCSLVCSVPCSNNSVSSAMAIQYMVQFLLSVVAMVVTIASCFIALWGFSLLTSLTMRRDLRTTQLQQLAIADMFYCFTFFCERFVDLSYEVFGLDLTFLEMKKLCGWTFALYLSGRTVSLLLEVHIAVSFLFGLSSAWSWTLSFPWIVGVIAGVTQTVDLQPGEQNQDHFCDVSATYVFLGSPALLTVLGLNVAIYGLVVLRHKFSKLSVGRLLLFLLSFLGPYTLRLLQDYMRKFNDYGAETSAVPVLELLKGGFDMFAYLVIGQLAKRSFRTTIRCVELELWDSEYVPSRASCCKRFCRWLRRAVLLVLTAMEECDDLEHALRTESFLTASVVSVPENNTPGSTFRAVLPPRGTWDLHHHHFFVTSSSVCTTRFLGNRALVSHRQTDTDQDQRHR